MHVTFNDVAVYLTEEEWRNLNRTQLQLYMEVMNENYASLQSLGLPVPEGDLLQCTEGPKWKKRPFCKAGDQSYAPLQADKASSGFGETISRTPRATGREANGCDPPAPTPSRKVPESHLTMPNGLASFKKEMLQDSSLKPKCLECKGILKCYCDVLKQKRKKPYVCEDCGKGYHLQMYLLLHQKSHFQEHFYKCSLCEKSFAKDGVLQKHMRTHQDTGMCLDSWGQASTTLLDTKKVAAVYSCGQCQEVFPSKNLLRNHSRKHKTVKTHSCLICGQIVQTYTELNVHLKGHNKPYGCTVCGKVFTNRPDFITHIREHSGEQMYKCRICMKGYSRLSGCIKHMNVHLSQATNRSNVRPEQPSSPGENNREPRGTVNTAFHGLSYKEQESGGTPFNFCPSTIKVNKDTSKVIHGLPYKELDGTPFKFCPSTIKVNKDTSKVIHGLSYKEQKLDGTPFKFCPSSMKVNMDTVTVIHGLSQKEQELARTPLDVCPSKLKVNTDMAKVFHGLSYKEQELAGTPFNICPATMKVNMDTTKKEETFDISTQHPMEFKQLKKGKRIICRKCKKGFRYCESFRRHRESHQVRFTCHQCGQVFRKLIKLYLHRRGHKDHRPFMCKHCTKTFHYRSLLFLHLNTHDPSEMSSRYPCAYCRKVFRSQTNCIVHQETHIYKPVESPTDNFLPTFSNIQIVPFSDHRSAEAVPLQEAPPSKNYVKRLSYRPCI